MLAYWMIQNYHAWSLKIKNQNMIDGLILNIINFLYKDLDYFINTHKKLKGRLFIIQLFIEDYILSKVQFEL